MEKDIKTLELKKDLNDGKGKKVKAKASQNKAKSKAAEEVKDVKISARFIRVAPRKVRLVIPRLIGLEAQAALDYLKFVNKASVSPLIKLIKSGIANAENNFQLDKKDLFIKKIVADGGPVLKRYRPRAHGRSAAIRKRTSHINLVLGVKPGAKKKIAPRKEADKKEEVKVVGPEEVKKQGPKTPSKGPAEKGKSSKGFLRGIFQRKTG
ncbi:50S ribosomal protein L22 [Candidatus Falkowbacteria bacterium]|nr:50S ribosomal protein L22 [Candidatus Falkowbacteria bacterium]